MNVLQFLYLFACGVSAFQFGSRISPKSTSLSMAAKEYSVRIINKKKNADNTIQVPSDKFILDIAEAKAVGIPYSCRAGSCSSCVGRLTEGTVDQSSQIFLESDKIDQGFILTCVAFPTSNCVVEVDIEDEFYNSGDNSV